MGPHFSRENYGVCRGAEMSEKYRLVYQQPKMKKTITMRHEKKAEPVRFCHWVARALVVKAFTSEAIGGIGLM
jgi:hypothetical protein